MHSVSSLNEEISQIIIKYKIKDLSFLPDENLKIEGTALAYSKQGPERLFIVANYESSHQKVISYLNKN